MNQAHLQELRERQTYTKPKTVRRKQKQKAIREQQKITILEKIENGDTKFVCLLRKRKKRNQIQKTKIKINLIKINVFYIDYIFIME